MWSLWPYQGRTLSIQASCFLSSDAAHFFLDRGVDQHAFDFGLLGSGADEGDVGRRPGFRIDVLPVVGDQIDRGDFLALFLAQPWPGIGMNQMSTSRPT